MSPKLDRRMTFLFCGSSSGCDIYCCCCAFFSAQGQKQPVSIVCTHQKDQVSVSDACACGPWQWQGCHGTRGSALLLFKPSEKALLTRIPSCKKKIWLVKQPVSYMINEQHVLTACNGQDTGEWLEIGIRIGTNGMDWGIGKMPICSAFLVTRIEMDFSRHDDIPSCPSGSIFEEGAATAVSDSMGSERKWHQAYLKFASQIFFFAYLHCWLALACSLVPDESTD